MSLFGFLFGGNTGYPPMEEGAEGELLEDNVREYEEELQPLPPGYPSLVDEPTVYCGWCGYAVEGAYCGACGSRVG